MTTLRFFSDPGHGWLEVPLQMIEELLIAPKISPYSYIDCSATAPHTHGTAYLEEDCDATIFLAAWKRTHPGERLQVEEKHCDGWIRNLRHYPADDTEEARVLTNQTARPKGPAGPTPEEALRSRQPITETERKAFDIDVRKRLNEARAKREQIRMSSGDLKAGDKDATLERDAVRRALVAGGYLRYRRS